MLESIKQSSGIEPGKNLEESEIDYYYTLKIKNSTSCEILGLAYPIYYVTKKTHRVIGSMRRINYI